MPEHKTPHIRLVSVAENPTPANNGIKGIPDLKLVPATGVIQEAQLDKTFQNKIQRTPQQLSFSFDDPYTVVLVNINRKDIHWFLDLLQSLSPTLILDARSVARLDVLCGNRAHAFKIFKSLKVEYIDLFGRLGITTYQSSNAQPGYWSEKINDVISKTSKFSGPVLIIFDNQNLLDSSVDVISSVFSNLLDHEISLSIRSC